MATKGTTMKLEKIKPVEDDPLEHKYRLFINSVIEKVLGASFDFSAVTCDFDFKAFRFIRLDLSEDVPKNIAELTLFLNERAFGFFNPAAVKMILATIKQYFALIDDMVDRVIVAETEYNKWQKCFAKTQKSNPLPSLAQAQATLFEFALLSYTQSDGEGNANYYCAVILFSTCLWGRLFVYKTNICDS